MKEKKAPYVQTQWLMMMSEMFQDMALINGIGCNLQDAQGLTYLVIYDGYDVERYYR